MGASLNTETFFYLKCRLFDVVNKQYSVDERNSVRFLKEPFSDLLVSASSNETIANGVFVSRTKTAVGSETTELRNNERNVYLSLLKAKVEHLASEFQRFTLGETFVRRWIVVAKSVAASVTSDAKRAVFVSTKRTIEEKIETPSLSQSSLNPTSTY